MPNATNSRRRNRSRPDLDVPARRSPFCMINTGPQLLAWLDSLMSFNEAGEAREES